MKMCAVGKKIRKGFTIVELMVVMVVIGILATLAVGASNGYFHNAADSAAQVSLEDAARKLDAYKLKNGEYNSAALSSYTPQQNVTLTQQSITSSAYCLKATHTKYSDIIYYANNQGSVTKTTC